MTVNQINFPLCRLPILLDNPFHNFPGVLIIPPINTVNHKLESNNLVSVLQLELSH